MLAAALLRAVGKGHDNELFVLLVDLVELEGRLAPLVRAVKVALARHHQVVLICPWPPDLDRPGETPPDSGLSFPGLGPGHDAGEAGPGKRRPRPVERQPRVRPGMSPQALREFLKRLTGQRYHRAFHRLRRTFARLQVPVVCAAADESVHLVLERLDRLRGLRRRR